MSTPEENTSSFSVEGLFRIVTFIGSSLIFFSILKAYVFYATFGIRITNYISFSEAILLFLNEVAVLIWYFMILSAVIAILYFVARRFHFDIRLIDIIVPDKSSPLFHKLFGTAVVVYPLFYLFYAIVMNAFNYSSTKNFVFIMITFIIMEVVVIVLVIELWRYVVKRKYSLQGKVFGYLVFAAILFFYTWSLERQLFLFHRNKINKTVVAMSKDRTDTLTNRSIQFLGSTEKYVFCYDLNKEMAIVVSTAQYDRIEFGTYKNLPGFSIFDLLFH